MGYSRCRFALSWVIVCATISDSPCYSHNFTISDEGEDILHNDTDPFRNHTTSGEYKQRVVLLVGPHKTASSSVQANLIRWTSEYDNRLPNWSWPQPSFVSSCNNGPKVFYPYFITLNGSGKEQCLRKQYKLWGLQEKDLLSDYKNAYRDEWSAGKSLVIASEAMDFVSSERTDGDLMLSRILDGLPWNSNDLSGLQLEGSNDDVTIVVKFRAPRVEHLVSLWHQCCMGSMTFYEYITIRLPSKKDPIRSLDSLRLVEIFLEKGFEVIIIDMEGATNKGYDISDVVACDVLGARCTPVKKIIGENILPLISNVKKHNDLYVSDDQLEMMEKAIRNYDCNFQNMMRHDSLTALYPEVLMKIFESCQFISQDSRIETRGNLVEVLFDITISDDIYYEHIT